MNLEVESKKCLTLVVSEVDQSTKETKEWDYFHNQLAGGFKDIFKLSFELYGHRYDFFYQIKQVVISLYDSFKKRDIHLKKRDETRLSDSNWFRSQNMVGMACYVDLFADDLQGIRNKIGYFKDLGINYVHLMPLFKSPDGESDGGYAISNYREVDPKLGDMEVLKQLANDFRQHGISLVLDFVFNHTADEHEWALKAKQGEAEFQDYYYVFDTKEEVEQYNLYLREIFPQIRRGSFTFDNQLKKWVWTTFNSFQWDLNYTNPAVFKSVLEEMLFLANIGSDVLRLDALAFTWKEKGTDCENLPKAHTLIKLFNACLSVVAPSVLLKSEAIVHPTEVNKYISSAECKLSYNPLLMALLWNSLATKKTRLINASMRESFAISEQCSWVNYVRCHDDIGWTFDDKVAQELGINGFDHRQFLNTFYKGEFPSSFSKGIGFGENPENGDCRIAGTLASLCGLERALELNDSMEIEKAAKRMLLLHSIILSIGGIPLLYYGDELSVTNDYGYLSDPKKINDARWVNRPKITNAHYAIVKKHNTIQNRLYKQLKNLITLRKTNLVFGNGKTEFLSHDNAHLFTYKRINNEGKELLVICNFSETEQYVGDIIPSNNALELLFDAERLQIDMNDRRLAPLSFFWLKINDGNAKA